MKKLITQLSVFLFTATTLTAQTQFPNSNFENWEDLDIKDSLDNWFSLLGTFYPNAPNVMRIEEGVSGNAVFMQTIEDFEGDLNPAGIILAQNIDDDAPEGYPYSSDVDALNAYLRYDIAPTDTGMVVVFLENDGFIFSFNTFPIYGVQSTWNLFTWDLGDPILTPDKVTIAFLTSGYSDNEPIVESWMEVDSVYFTNLGSTPALLPNFNFEDWTTLTIETCSNWYSFDPILSGVFGFENITKSTDAYSGDYSLRMEVFATNVEEDVFPFISNGNFNFETEELEGGTEFTGDPLLFKGQYKFSSDGPDSSRIYLRFWNEEGDIAEYLDTTLLPVADWTEFSLPIDLGFTPDSALTFITGGKLEGAITYFDDLRFVYDDVSVSEISKPFFEAYPNPANEYINLILEEKNAVYITDLVGKKYVESQNSATTIQINTADWPNGIYLIQVYDGQTFNTKRFAVQH